MSYGIFRGFVSMCAVNCECCMCGHFKVHVDGVIGRSKIIYNQLVCLSMSLDVQLFDIPYIPQLLCSLEDARLWCGFRCGSTAPFWSFNGLTHSLDKLGRRDHTDLSVVHHWLRSLSSAGGWVFLINEVAFICKFSHRFSPTQCHITELMMLRGFRLFLHQPTMCVVLD